MPRPPTPARRGLRRASPVHPWGPRTRFQAGWGSAPLLPHLPLSPRSFASDFFRGSFSRPRRREKVFLSSGSAMLGPGPGGVRAPGSGRAAPRPPRPARASPPAPRPAPAGSAFRECLAQTFFFFFFFPFPRPERAMLGDVVSRPGREGAGTGALCYLPGLQL